MIYLDNAATTFPKPECVLDEINNCLKNYCGNPGRSSHIMSVKSSEIIYDTRVLIGEMFNASPENVVFTYNTTYALNIAIKSNYIDGSHILISDIEHNSVYRPVLALAKDKKITFDIFSTDGTDEEILENVKQKLKRNTKMIICTHMSNISSRRLPIEKIGKLCHSLGINFIVDGAQSAGIYKIDVSNMYIDALCIPAHKSLYGPQGVGIIVFRSYRQGRTLFEGGSGIDSLDENMPDFLPERYEAGTLSTPSIAGLNKALEWVKAISIDRIRCHEEGLYSLLISNLSKNEHIEMYRDKKHLGNTLLFNCKNMSSQSLNDELNKRDICVRSGLHCSPLGHKAIKGDTKGAVRVSFGVFNTSKDVFDFVDALWDITQKK